MSGSARDDLAHDGRTAEHNHPNRGDRDERERAADERDSPVTADDGDGVSGAEFYTRPDGIEDATWMRPHRELLDSLPLTDEQRQAVNDAFDAIYRTTIEHRNEEHQTEHDLLVALFRSVPNATRPEHPAEPHDRPTAAGNHVTGPTPRSSR